MTTSTILFVSDAHGDSASFDRVQQMVAGEIDDPIRCFLGDAVGYGDDPVGILRRVADYDLLIVGNHDQLLLNPDEPGIYSTRARDIVDDHREMLGQAEREILRRFVPTAGLDGILLYHGSPHSCHDYLYDETDMEPLLREFPEYSIFIGGHFHFARLAAFDRVTNAVEFMKIPQPLGRFTLDTSRYRYFVLCPSVTPGRMGFEHPGCCVLRTDGSRRVLEFRFSIE